MPLTPAKNLGHVVQREQPACAGLLLGGEIGQTVINIGFDKTVVPFPNLGVALALFPP